MLSAPSAMITLKASIISCYFVILVENLEFVDEYLGLKMGFFLMLKRCF